MGEPLSIEATDQFQSGQKHMEDPVNHGNSQLFLRNKGPYSVVACVQESLEKSSSIVEMSSILLSLPFFSGGNSVLEIWEQGSKNECVLGLPF